MIKFLNTAITCGPDPLRTRLASSFNVPSRRPCSPFSIPQCARTASSSFAAPARSRDRLGDPQDHFHLDLLTRTPLALQAEHLPAARPVVAQVVLQPGRQLQRPLLDPTMPLVHGRGPLQAGGTALALEAVRSGSSGCIAIFKMTAIG